MLKFISQEVPAHLPLSPVAEGQLLGQPAIRRLPPPDKEPLVWRWPVY
mgnify:CR=1 FL=1